ncbi:ribonuclease III [Odoribacter lunatus]|uniref:ribonuclease III n=1 Tax=Odoribacter lunatus TaxID=2941335 RepID=UPI00203A6A30|nr:ribonuclease III [Odoribacter lunatus]
MISKIIQSIRLYLHRKDKFYGLSISQIGFVPGNHNLYKLALLHKSASKYTREGAVLNYERLEFLGDAVLSAIVAELLYKFFPLKDEGFLTRVRSKMVSRESLNELAINIGLDKAVVAKSDLSKNKHVYGDVFEAFVGAMFLDQGFVNTKRFFDKFIFPNFFNLKDLVTIDTNYKSQLIEWGQKNKREVVFEIRENFHSRKNRFICKILIAGKQEGRGTGASKKEAEQNAAAQVMEKIRLQME